MVEKQGWDPCGRKKKLPVDIEEDDANHARAVSVRKNGNVIGHVPRACLMASIINEDS